MRSIAFAVCLLATPTRADEPYDLVIRNGQARRWHRQSVVPRRRRRPRRQDRRRRPRHRQGQARDRREGPGRRPRLHRHALALRHAAARRRQRAEQDPPGRDDRGPRRRHLGRAVHGRAAAEGRRTDAAWTTLGDYFDAVEKAGIAVNVASLRRARQRLAVRDGQVARPADARAVRADEEAARRGDEGRGVRPVEHADDAARLAGHDRRPRRAVQGRGEARRHLLVAHPQRGDRRVRRGEGGDRGRRAGRRAGGHHPPQDRRPEATGAG